MKLSLNIKDLVKVKGEIGVYKIIGIDVVNDDCVYRVCPKHQYDKWDGDNIDTVPSKILTVNCDMVTKV